MKNTSLIFFIFISITLLVISTSNARAEFSFISEWGGYSYWEEPDPPCMPGDPDPSCQPQEVFEELAGIAVDNFANVYVTYRSSIGNRIRKFDSNGNFMIQWGETGTADGQFINIGAIAVDNIGNVYVADGYNQRIQKFDSNGNFITKWDAEGFMGIAVDNSGNVYIALFAGPNSPHANHIKKFDSNGNFITSWGAYGDGDGQVSWLHGIETDNLGNVYVADAGNNRIQKFDSNGNFITKWGTAGSGDGQFLYVHDIAVDSSGNVYVTEPYNNFRIQKFDSDANFITSWTTNTRSIGIGYPATIDVDIYGNVYVTDLWSHTVHKFGDDSQLTTIVGIDIKPGSEPSSINLSSAGVIPVAILSSDTFDATTVDPDTVNMAGARVKMVGKSNKYLAHEEDVNDDGLLDLVCQVETVDFLIVVGESVAVLEAETYDGAAIRGEDSVKIVPDY